MKNLTEAEIKYRGFSKKQLLDVYRLMALSRLMDDKMMVQLRQGKAYFHIGCSGHEAVQVAAALNFEPGKDWAYPYYREQAFCLTWGETPQELYLCFLAKRDDPNSGGRQMPMHYGHQRLRIVSQSSPTGTQLLPAVGTAMAAARSGGHELTYVSLGEGTTSQGDFHEALNWASREKLPIIFHVQDNKYAISVPIAEQTAGASVYKLVQGYEGLEKLQVDGTDFFASHEAFNRAVKRARLGEGPSIVVSDVVRLLPHSSSDDHRKYRSPEDLAKDRERDPILRFASVCSQNKIIGESEFKELWQHLKKEVDELADWALVQPEPDPATAAHHVYSAHPQPPRPAAPGGCGDLGVHRTPVRSGPLGAGPRSEISAPEAPGALSRGADPAAPPGSGKNVVMVDAINHALAEELERHPKMLIYGQDVAGGKGGVFTATRELTSRFGKERVFNSPLAESSIVGTAIGLAVAGYKPVVEIQFGDYIWPAMMHIRNELAMMRYRSNGAWKADVVIRVPVGGYIHGGIYHSQSIEGYFAHMPGIRVVFPSNAADAKGLLKASIRGEDPVLFLEHKGLYRQGFAARPEPPSDYVLPLGCADVLREGSDLTVIAWGMMVQRCLDAMSLLDEISPSVELIDPRTLNPFDWDTVYASVKKTGKVLIVHEENLTGGFGAEISARIASDLYSFLDGPPQRAGAQDTPIPYSPVLEAEILPSVTGIAQAMRNLLTY